MALDQLKIGIRLRKIREEIYKETRDTFSERCGLKKSHLAQIERGEILPSLAALDKIASNCGTTLDYLIYGLPRNCNIRNTLDNFLNKSSPEEIRIYFKFIASVKNITCKFNSR